MKHLLTTGELDFLRKIVNSPAIIKHDFVSQDGIPTNNTLQSLIKRGYCKTAKVLNGPLAIWSGEYFIMLTEAGRTILEHISEVPIAVLL